MAFTLDKLAAAMRGMPRDAAILVRLPDGTLREIDHVASTRLGASGAAAPSAEQGRYGIVLVVEG